MKWIDKIRTVSDEELADILVRLGDGSNELGYCTNKPECEEAVDCGGDITREMCRACLMAWLRGEAV